VLLEKVDGQVDLRLRRKAPDAEPQRRVRHLVVRA
jgi:hypothetical protein